MAPEAIEIDATTSVPLSEVRFETGPSSGPGGQHVNKAETRVTLIFDLDAARSLSEDEVARVRCHLATRLTKQGEIRVSSQSHRSQKRNRDEAIQRFAELHERFLSEIEQAIVGLESGELELADVLPGGGDGGEATVERGGPSPDAGGKYCELIYSYHCPDDEYYPPFYDSGRWGGGSDCGETDLPGGYYVYYVDTWYVYRSVCP